MKGRIKMWNRAIFKANAKIPLRQTYWTAFLVSLVALILAGVSNSATNTNNFNALNFSNETIINVTSKIIVFAGTIFSAVYIAFISNILSLGEKKFYMENRKCPTKFSALFDGFRCAYLQKVIVLFMRNLFIALWSILLFVPGVIAYYRYWTVEYLLNENPNLNWQHAIDMSKRMTDGRKTDLFVLDLSFIGWVLLTVFTCGLGVFFLNPYISATKVEAYEFLKQESLQMGKISPEEFQSNM